MIPTGIRSNCVVCWGLAVVGCLTGGIVLAEAVVNAPGSVVGFTALALTLCGIIYLARREIEG